jgi:type IV pilus assembly protein PilC
MFADIFKRFGGDLPGITKLVLQLSYIIKNSFGLFALINLTILIFCFSQRKQPWFRNFSSNFILRIPLVGKIVQKIYLSRFSNTMALLIGAKIPILQAINLVEQMINFYPIEKSLQKISNDVLAGEPLFKSLGKHNIFPSKLTSLIKVGEEVNQLEIFFNKISQQYANEVEYQTNLLSKFIEPFIIVLLGLIVGVILIAMYLPLFKLGQNI